MYPLPDLPYARDALEPTVSSATMTTHHDKHHKAYVDKLNELAPKAGLDGPLEDVVRAAATTRAENPKLFNNAAQAWNHAFFWVCMTPNRQAPSADLAAAIDTAFGDLASLKAKFVQEGVDHFASGWVWLVLTGGALQVISTHDADTAMLHNATPILVCDVWEHAYYLDYKQDRKGFLETWFDTVADWRFAGEQYDASKAGKPGWRYPAPVNGLSGTATPH